jgi:hypothetical protein
VLVAEATDAPLRRLEGLKAEILALQAQLHFVRMRAWRRRGTFADEISELRLPEGIDKTIRDAVERLLPFNVDSCEQHPVATAWRQACEVLRRDADAPLPS